ncbi:MAG: 16S rRNA (cytosine(1402)-N(4))-methyltransferase RsmH [Leptonema sp. (in: Bacteria)]|nr:16S rRNA (cytosine(1402)-N(4))-methyltransferase RsmH [Leptonema sp. (in: bacteria)]
MARHFAYSEESTLNDSLRLADFIQSHSVSHIPVLFEPVLLSLNAMNLDSPVIVDATLGEGGHSRGMLRLLPNATLIGFDQDTEMIERARSRFIEDGFELAENPTIGKVCVVRSRFSEIAAYLTSQNLLADFLLVDLGVAMFHFDAAKRGFSFRDTSLDMRLDERLVMTAADVINSYTENELSRILFEYGEERMSRQIAKRIVSNRPINSADKLTDIVLSVLIRHRDRSSKRGFIKDSDAAKVFQAIRIEVNSELDQIKSLLADLPKILTQNGRAAFISFHSIEDRLVKHGFQNLLKSKFEVLTRKPILSDSTEIDLNLASRSAKLRVIQKSNFENEVV